MSGRRDYGADDRGRGDAIGEILLKYHYLLGERDDPARRKPTRRSRRSATSSSPRSANGTPGSAKSARRARR